MQKCCFIFFLGQLQLPTNKTSKHWDRSRCGVGAGQPPELQGLGSSRRWGRSPPPAARAPLGSSMCSELHWGNRSGETETNLTP